MRVAANGIHLECEARGPRDGPALILIRGLGSQLVHWPEELTGGFATMGYRVVVFDNRDAGLSARWPAPGWRGRPMPSSRTCAPAGFRDRPMRSTTWPATSSG